LSSTKTEASFTSAAVEKVGAVANYLEAYRPDEIVDRISDINVEKLVKMGINTLVVDAESTITVFDGFEVPDDIANWFKEARELGIDNIFISTNKRPKSTDDIVQIEYWLHQIGADLAYVPLDKSQRKPVPYMLQSIMQEHNLEKTQIAAFGDKVSSDILAANFAGAYSGLVGRLGDEDHPGDRALRRPYEKGLLAMQHVLKGSYFGGLKPKELEEIDNVEETEDFELEIDFEIPAHIIESGKIVGITRPAIELDDEHKALLPPPRFQTLNDIKALATENPLWLRYMDYLEENGEDHGEFLTKIRPYIGALALAAQIKGYRKTAVGLYLLTHVTDGLDGLAIRKSDADLKSDRRTKGANDDRQADQIVSLEIGAGHVITGDKPKWLFGLQNARSFIRNKQVKWGTEDKGYNTKADQYSKAANEVLGVADILLTAAPNSKTAKVAQGIATLMRYDSMRYSQQVVWPYRQLRAERAEEANRVLEQDYSSPA